MTHEEIKQKIKEPQYDFLRDSPLNGNIVLLGLGGSYAYGTNNENSDLDIRGVAINPAHDILIHKDFECVVDKETDTTIYSFEKILKLLAECNPNTIELLGLRPQDYLYISPIGEQLIRNKRMFLSKRAAFTFGGYANAQLRRLENKCARLVGQEQNEKNILKSISNAQYDYKRRYFEYPEDAINLYVDKSEKEGMDSEIFMDIHLTHYPLRDYKSMWNDMNSIVKDYKKIGKRNQQAIEHNKIGKHMMHLVRLYLMCFDILEHGEIITYREKEHDFLMDIRNGKYLDDNRQPTKEFYDIVNELEGRFDYLKDHNCLPENPDYEAINNFLRETNKQIVSRG